MYLPYSVCACFNKVSIGVDVDVTYDPMSSIKTHDGMPVVFKRIAHAQMKFADCKTKFKLRLLIVLVNDANVLLCIEFSSRFVDLICNDSMIQCNFVVWKNSIDFALIENDMLRIYS